jgi:hypothetical protein
MKAGDKVICINDNKYVSGAPYSVAIGQIYEVSYFFSQVEVVSLTELSEINKSNDQKIVYSDRIRLKEKGNNFYPTEIFITLEKYREQQLNKLV